MGVRTLNKDMIVLSLNRHRDGILSALLVLRTANLASVIHHLDIRGSRADIVARGLVCAHTLYAQREGGEEGSDTAGE